MEFPKSRDGAGPHSIDWHWLRTVFPLKYILKKIRCPSNDKTPTSSIPTKRENGWRQRGRERVTLETPHLQSSRVPQNMTSGCGCTLRVLRPSPCGANLGEGGSSLRHFTLMSVPPKTVHPVTPRLQLWLMAGAWWRQRVGGTRETDRFTVVYS